MERIRDRSTFLSVHLASKSQWNAICKELTRHLDHDCYFGTAYMRPIYILETRPGAERAAEIGNKLFSLQSFDDGETADRLFCELEKITGHESAEWFFADVINRWNRVRKEDQEDRAWGWLQNHDVVEIMDNMGDYDSMYQSLLDVYGFSQQSQAADAIFVYGYLYGLAMGKSIENGNRVC